LPRWRHKVEYDEKHEVTNDISNCVEDIRFEETCDSVPITEDLRELNEIIREIIDLIRNKSNILVGYDRFAREKALFQ
jgi:hypothetical protein